MIVYGGYFEEPENPYYRGMTDRELALDAPWEDGDEWADAPGPMPSMEDARRALILADQLQHRDCHCALCDPDDYPARRPMAMEEDDLERARRRAPLPLASLPRYVTGNLFAEVA